MTPDLIRRQTATEHTLKRYRRRDFDWSQMTTCVALAWFHAKKMGRKPPKIPLYRSPLGALKVLKQLGCTDCGELVDKIPDVERIAPAQMMMGDLAMCKAGVPEGERETPGAVALAGIGTIVLCLGPHKIIGWRADTGNRLVVLDIGFDQIDAAWRL